MPRPPSGDNTSDGGSGLLLAILNLFSIISTESDEEGRFESSMFVVGAVIFAAIARFLTEDRLVEILLDDDDLSPDDDELGDDGDKDDFLRLGSDSFLL